MVNILSYYNQTSLGKVFGVSSHVIGRWLKELGLRTDSTTPTSYAFDHGFCKSEYTGKGEGTYYWVWHAKLTIDALQKAGHRRVDQKPAPTALIGPFTSRHLADENFEIVGSDGVVNVEVHGRANAEMVVKLMNLAHQHGKFSPTTVAA